MKLWFLYLNKVVCSSRPETSDPVFLKGFDGSLNKSIPTCIIEICEHNIFTSIGINDVRTLSVFAPDLVASTVGASFGLRCPS